MDLRIWGGGRVKYNNNNKNNNNNNNNSDEKILILFGTIYIKFYKRQNYSGRKQISCCQGSVSGNCKKAHRNFLEIMQIFYDLMWHCIYMISYISQNLSYYKL